MTCEFKECNTLNCNGNNKSITVFSFLDVSSRLTTHSIQKKTSTDSLKWRQIYNFLISKRIGQPFT